MAVVAVIVVAVIVVGGGGDEKRVARGGYVNAWPTIVHTNGTC